MVGVYDTQHNTECRCAVQRGSATRETNTHKRVRATNCSTKSVSFLVHGSRIQERKVIQRQEEQFQSRSRNENKRTKCCEHCNCWSGSFTAENSRALRIRAHIGCWEKTKLGDFFENGSGQPRWFKKTTKMIRQEESRVLFMLIRSHKIFVGEAGSIDCA